MDTVPSVLAIPERTESDEPLNSPSSQAEPPVEEPRAEELPGPLPLQLIVFSDDIFQPFLPSLQSVLPSDMEMRLPEEIRLIGLEGNEVESPMIAITPLAQDLGVAVDVRVCGLGSDCILGNFSVGRRSHPSVARGLQYHEEQGYPITLAPGISGHLLTKLPDGDESPVMSLLWEQENAVYRVQFPSQDRQNILLMAQSMVVNAPIVARVDQRSEVAMQESSDATSRDLSNEEQALIEGEISEQDNAEKTDEALISRADERHDDDLNLGDVQRIGESIIFPREPFEENLNFPLPNVEDQILSPGGDSEPVLPSEEEVFCPDVAQQVNDQVVVQRFIVQRALLGAERDRPSEENDKLVFNEREFKKVIEDFLGQSIEEPLQLSRTALNEVACAITQEYVGEGYLTSRAISVTVDENGVAVIRVAEGEVQVLVSAIEEYVELEERPENAGTEEPETSQTNGVDGEQVDENSSGGEPDEDWIDCSDPGRERVPGLRLQASYVCDRIQLGTRTPLRSTDLETQLRLLRFNPLFDRVEATLSQGDAVGQSNLTVKFKLADPFEFQLSTDNYASPNIGAERAGIQALHRNLTGFGDTLEASFYRSFTGGLNTGNIRYTLPVNGMNGTLQVGATLDRTEVTQAPFDELNIEGETERYNINFRQPLIRSLKEELALSWGFRYHDGQNLAIDDFALVSSVGPDLDGVIRTDVLTFGQDYTRRDPWGAWSLASQFNFGVDLFDATTNDEPVPDSRFFSWQGNFQRIQHLGNPVTSNHLLVIRAATQLTPDSLLSSERFVMGGGQTLRGYRQNARSGDNGVRFSIEDRITLARQGTGEPSVQLVPFLDAGAVWNSGNNPNELFTPSVLVGTGMGIIWSDAFGLDDLQFKVDFAAPLVPIEDNNNDLQDLGVFFEMLYHPQ